MDIITYLDQEWVPALGCTEPASIAYAGLTATEQLNGNPEKINLTVDPRIYKNCHAVGIPHSHHKTGIKWAATIGAFLKNSGAKLECFRDINDETLTKAGDLIDAGQINVVIDRSKTNLYIHFEVSNERGKASCTIEDSHMNITNIQKGDETIFEGENQEGFKGNTARTWANTLSTEEVLKIVKEMGPEAHQKIKEGAYLNRKIAEHGLTLFPKGFVKMISSDSLTRISGLVCCGVYARMWGEDFPVMSIAGSGNKGIVCSVPLVELEKEWKIPSGKFEEALAIAMFFTSKTTEELGTLSAVCGCSNAAGIGLACAIVYLMDGGTKEISYAINNMVGNVTGMICDGAKIGCAMKTMTAVDSAFRAATLAINGIGIPVEDGIVGKNGRASLANMGKIAKQGMLQTDDEILKIMESKL